MKLTLTTGLDLLGIIQIHVLTSPPSIDNGHEWVQQNHHVVLVCVIPQYVNRSGIWFQSKYVTLNTDICDLLALITSEKTTYVNA